MSDTGQARNDLVSGSDHLGGDRGRAVPEGPSVPAFWRVDSSPFSRPGAPHQPAREITVRHRAEEVAQQEQEPRNHSAPSSRRRRS